MKPHLDFLLIYDTLETKLFSTKRCTQYLFFYTISIISKQITTVFSKIRNIMHIKLSISTNSRDTINFSIGMEILNWLKQPFGNTQLKSIFPKIKKRNSQTVTSKLSINWPKAYPTENPLSLCHHEFKSIVPKVNEKFTYNFLVKYASISLKHPLSLRGRR